MKKILRLAALVFIPMVLLSGCLTSTIHPNDTHTFPTNFTYPAGNTYDWLWVSWTENMADNALPTLGATSARARVCFPDMPGGFVRSFAVPNPWIPDDEIYPGQSFAGCTDWIKIAEVVALPQGGVDVRSTGWQKMVGGMLPGETFSIMIRFDNNWSNQVHDVWTDAVVATGDLSTVWYTF